MGLVVEEESPTRTLKLAHESLQKYLHRMTHASQRDASICPVHTVHTHVHRYMYIATTSNHLTT